MKNRSWVGLSLLLLACGDSGASAGGGSEGAGDTGGAATGGAETTGGAPSTGGAGGEGGSGGAQAQMRKLISGDMTWNVDFDADAEAAGATDCSYQRHFEGIEDRTRPFLCANCEVIFKASVEMTAGQEDCYSQVSDVDPSAEEWIGYGNGKWYRGYGIVGEQGTAEITGTTIAQANAVEDLPVEAGGLMAFDITGSFELSEEEGAPNDFAPVETYACGWPKANPPAYEGDYVLAVGATLPDGTFYDRCEEGVRLHDFKGKFLIVDMSARDCAPCQQMAGAEAAFLADMKAEGIDVEMITLLAPSLAEPLNETSTTMLENWTNTHDLESPVLGDTWWGITMFAPIFQQELGYPSWALVDPDLKVLNVYNGFANFDEVADIIRDASAP